MRSTFKVLFYLKRDKNNPREVVPIMGRITVNGTIAQFSAKISIPESLWDVSGNKAKGKSLEADRINRHLDNIRGQIHKHYQEISDRDGYVTAEKVKNAYLGFGDKYLTLVTAFQKFIDDYKRRVGVDRSAASLRGYVLSLNHLRSFLKKEYRISDMPLLQLETSFIEKFHSYLSDDRGLKPTSASTHLAYLKYVIKICFNNGWMPRNPFASYRFIPPQVERGYLTEEEIQRLMTTPLHNRSRNRTRDMFLFSCFTGICYADMNALAWKQFEQDARGDWWVTGCRKKTGSQYVVKLLPVPLAILDKYRGLAGPEKVFLMSANKVMDRSLKRIAAECGIAKNLTFHMARHTFATTICLSQGVPLITVSKMLGHKHITTTQIYAKITRPMIDEALTTLQGKLEGKFAL